MPRPIQPNTPQTRDRAQAWLRRATRALVLGAAGVAALIGIVVAQEHPGSSSPAHGTGGTGSGSSGGSNSGTNSGTSGSSSSSNSGNSGSSNTGSTGNTGNSGTTTTPSTSRSTPAVTSGGTSR